MSVLDADTALAFCIFASFGLRALIVGERFDRALHRADPTYRNTRDMTRAVLVDPIAGLKGLPKAYGRYYGVTLRPVGDPETERLRVRAVRAWVEAAVFGLGGFLAVFVAGALLRRVSAGVHDIAVLAALAFVGLYWVRRLLQELDEHDRSTVASLYMLGGIAAAVAAFVFVVIVRSTLA